MKTKILTLGIVMMLLLVYPAMAAVQSYTVNYKVQSVTTFSVDPKSAQLYFNGTRSSTWLEPLAADYVTVLSKPWANITNTGNTQQTFYIYSTLPPDGIILLASNFSSMNPRIPVPDLSGIVSPSGWTNVQPGANVSLYLRANYTLRSDLTPLPDNTYTDTLKISNTDTGT